MADHICDRMRLTCPGWALHDYSVGMLKSVYDLHLLSIEGLGKVQFPCHRGHGFITGVPS